MTTKSTVSADFSPMLVSLQKATDLISKLGADAQSKMAGPVANAVDKISKSIQEELGKLAALNAAMDNSAGKSKDAAKGEDALSKEIREAGDDAEKAAGKVNKLAAAKEKLAVADKRQRAAQPAGQPSSTTTNYGGRYLDLETDPIGAVRADRARREAERKAAGRARAAGGVVQGPGVPLTQLSGAKVKRLIPKAVVPETVVEAVMGAATTQASEAVLASQIPQLNERQKKQFEQLAERTKRAQARSTVDPLAGVAGRAKARHGLSPLISDAESVKLEQAKAKREQESRRRINKDHGEALKMEEGFERERKKARDRMASRPSWKVPEFKAFSPYTDHSSMFKALAAQGLGKTGAQRFFDSTLGQRAGVERMISQGNLNASPLWMRGDQEDFLHKSYDQLLAKAKSEGLSLEAAIKSLVDARREEISAIKNTEKAAESAAKATQKKAEADLKSNEKRKAREAYDLDRAHTLALKENRTFNERAERRRQAQIAATQARYVRNSQAASNWSPIGSNWFAGPLGGAVTRLGGLVPSSSAAFVARHSVTGLLAGHAVGGIAQKGVGAIGSLAGQGLAKIGGSMGGVLGGVVGGGLGVGVPVAGQLLGATMNAMITYQATKISAAVLAGVKIIQTAFQGVSAAFGLIKNALMGVARFLFSWGLRGIAGAGVAGVAAIAHGVRSFATEEKSLVGMRVVARGAAPGMEALADKLNKNSIFSKSDLIEGIKQGLAFGLAPAQITKFLPKMMDSAALFGEDIGQGLRALTRAAFQAEPEAAERYGLNLYEKNLKAQFGDRFDLENPAQKVIATLTAADMQLQRFSGGMEKALQTVNGTFLYLKNKVNDTFVNLGKGFSQGFDLTGRTRAMGERFAQPQTQGLAYGIGNTVGGWLGKGADYLAKSMPSMDNVISFFSKEDEGDVWSQRGDALKAFAAQAVAVFQMIGEQARAAFAFLTDPGGELAQGLNNIIQSFVATGWQDSAIKMVDILIEQLGKLNAWADGFAKRTAAVFAEEMGKQMPGFLWATTKGVYNGVGSAGASGLQEVADWVTSLSKNFLESQNAVTAGTPIPKFANGGTVDAPEGKAVPAIVHGGEMVLNRAQQKALGIRSYAEGTLSSGERHSLVAKLSNERRRQYVRMMSRGADGATLEEFLKKQEGWADWQKWMSEKATQGIGWINGHLSEFSEYAKEKGEAGKKQFKEKSAAAMPSVVDFFDQGAQALQKTKAGAPGHKDTGYMSGSPMKMGGGAAGLGGKPTGYMAGLQKEAMKYFQQMQAQQAYSGLVNRFFTMRQLTTDPMGERMGFANPVGHPMARLFANSRNPMAQMINMRRAMMDASMYMQGGGQRSPSSNVRLDPENAAHVKYFNAVWKQQNVSQGLRDAQGGSYASENAKMVRLERERRENEERKQQELAEKENTRNSGAKAVKRYGEADGPRTVVYGTIYANNIDAADIRREMMY